MTAPGNPRHRVLLVREWDQQVGGPLGGLTEETHSIAWALRDYCRLAGVRTTYIEPGSPWENPLAESFN